MKKLTFVLILIAIILSLGSLSLTTEAKMFRGMKGESIKVIQEILKENPTIYPEGYVTGYFGPLTEKAIKRVQKKCGLPKTGILDEETQKCIFPIKYKVKVVFPNGGEVLDRNQLQTIKWSVETVTPSSEGLKTLPLWKKASIDLFRKVKISLPCNIEEEYCESIEKSVFVKHIATVNLFDQFYAWKITSDIRNSKEYVIRISVGPGVGSIWYREKAGKLLPSTEEIWPSARKIVPFLRHISWDESDKTFEITGTISPKPVPNVDQIIAILEKIAKDLRKAIVLLKKLGE